MQLEVVYATPGLSMAGSPMTRFLHIRVDNTVYFVHLLSYQEPSTRSQVIILGYQREGMDTLFTHIPYDDDTFAWAARQMGDESGPELFVLIDGKRHAVDFKQLRVIETATMVDPVWCPVANVVRERPYGPGGKETRRGSNTLPQAQSSIAILHSGAMATSGYRWLAATGPPIAMSR